MRSILELSTSQFSAWCNTWEYWSSSSWNWNINLLLVHWVFTGSFLLDPWWPQYKNLDNMYHFYKAEWVISGFFSLSCLQEFGHQPTIISDIYQAKFLTLAFIISMYAGPLSTVSIYFFTFEKVPLPSKATLLMHMASWSAMKLPPPEADFNHWQTEEIGWIGV